ncbi:MAG: Uma2 family endonuclease [Hymenobacter sp.]|nr:Uma2 family endonuclease [Hymenobacter sp.]
MPPITSLSQLDLSKSYTYADYLTWEFPERTELIRGKVRQMSPITWRVHQEISLNLMVALHKFVRSKPWQAFHAPFDVRLPHVASTNDALITNVVQPDISVFSDARKLDDRGGIGAPDWIIEILSPETMDHAIRTKFSLYEESGVQEYWLVTPGLKNVVAYTLGNGRYHLRGEFFEPGLIPVHTLPEFGIEWAEVFEGV